MAGIITGVLAGCMAGLFQVPLARRVCAYKCRQKELWIYRLWGRQAVWISMAVEGALFGMACSGGWGIRAVFLCLFAVLAVTGTLVDIRHRIIPNELVLVFLLLGLIYESSRNGIYGVLEGFSAMVFTGCLFALASRVCSLVCRQMGVGAGDLKLAAAAAFALGIGQMADFWMGMAAAVAVYCAGGIYLRKLGPGDSFPMCGQIMAGFLIALYGPELLAAIEAAQRFMIGG